MSDTQWESPLLRRSPHSNLVESVYCLLVESIPNFAFYLIDLDGTIRTWNRGAEHLLGYSAEEATGRPMAFIFTEQDRSAGLPQALLDACMRDGEVQSEGWRVRKNGTEFWGSMTLAAVRDEQSRLLGWSQLVQDRSQQKAVQDALQEREATISALLDSAAQGILAADSSGKIIWANAMSAEMFCYTQSEITSLAIEDLLPGALREKHRLHRSSYFSNPKKRPMGIGVDLTGRRKSGEEFPIEVSLSHLNTKGGSLGVAFVSDISQRKRSEQLLERSEAMHRMLFERTPQPMWVHDSDNSQFLMVNEAAVSLYGYSKDEFLSLTVQALTAADAPPASELIPLDPHLISHQKKDGTLVWVDQRSHAIEISGKPANLVLVTDVTERLDLENAVAAERDRYQALAGRMREVQEQERLHLSREIHDALGQELTGLKFRLQQMTGTAGALAPELGSATASIDKLIAKLRDIAAHLRPPVLDHLALPDAIEWLSEDFGERTGIICTARVQHTLPTVPDDVKLAVFRVCQEALTNVQRHSKASEVSVSLSRQNGNMMITIEDNGSGFVQDLNASGSLGLLGMRERAESMGGSLVVESSPGEGTRIYLTTPLPEGKSRI